MEVNTQRRKAGLDEKIPDIQKTLETVKFLKTRKVWLLISLNGVFALLRLSFIA